ncbi:group II intron reverse transcriptase domain-containing protein [Candidatus Uhrbacteria bacterium]|nr:group II intron reverse transcriptase domain-containing protein [Candidatus Uhrbacteria bacterium]
MKIQLGHTFQDIISIDNLCLAWQEFLVGKSSKYDVREFGKNLMDNLISLREELESKSYKHSPYESFFIHDPKLRHIHKAAVRDRLLHHAIHRILYPFFERTFISDTYSCRLGKGTLKAMDRFHSFYLKESRNHTKTCWVLKGDIKKCFASIDQEILIDILMNYIPDNEIMWLLEEVIRSFSDTPGIGLPLGNLTSQLFINVYMNEFDQFVKHKLKCRYYLRYADDWAILSQDRVLLESLISPIDSFLKERLHLTLHPKKIILKTYASGVDFLGWIHFPKHRVLRTKTRYRMIKRLKDHPVNETLQSYIGLLSHGDAHETGEELFKITGFLGGMLCRSRHDLCTSLPSRSRGRPLGQMRLKLRLTPNSHVYLCSTPRNY